MKGEAMTSLLSKTVLKRYLISKAVRLQASADGAASRRETKTYMDKDEAEDRDADLMKL